MELDSERRLVFDEHGRVDGELPFHLGTGKDDEPDPPPSAWDRLVAVVSHVVFRHPLITATIAIVAVAISGGSYYLSNRPPPPDGLVHARVFITQLTPSFDGNTGFWTEATLIVDRTGYRATSVGIVGPGLVDPNSTGPVATVAAPAQVQVNATLQCTSTPLATTADDYRLRVKGTDSAGDSTIVDLPLGPASSQWRDYIASACLSRLAATAVTVERATVLKANGRDVTVALRVHNDSRYYLTISAVQAGPGDVIQVSSARGANIGAQSTATVSATLRVEDCGRSARAFGPGSSYFIGMYTSVRGLTGASFAPAVTTQASRTIQNALNSQCAGGPKQSAAVVGARSLRTPGTGIAGEVHLSIRIIGPPDGFAADTAPPQQMASDDVALVTTSIAAEANSMTVEVSWPLVDCGYGAYLPPPIFYYLLTSHGQRYPHALVINSAQALTALRSLCGGIPDAASAKSVGWQLPTP